MFDEVPVRVWLLILFGLVAFRPARYVYRHVTHSPSRRDITQPAEDLSWRTTGQFVQNASVLTILAALAVFIFTPAAEQVASSTRFWPSLAALFGVLAVFTVVRGFRSGRIQPLAKGFYATYERHEHPKRFWASMAWNTALGSLMVWAAYQGNQDASAQVFADRCTHPTDIQFVREQLAACDDQVRLRPRDVEAYMDRGLFWLDGWAFDPAIADFTKAHELDPQDPWPLANRGVALAWQKKRARAQEDLDAARAMDPTNPVMLRGEAILKKDAGDPRGAVVSLTESLRHDPDNVWALRTRSELNWELGEEEKSIADDQRWVQLVSDQRRRHLAAERDAVASR